jgi:hypothetical protein
MARAGPQDGGVQNLPRLKASNCFSPGDVKSGEDVTIFRFERHQFSFGEFLIALQVSSHF